LSVSGKNDEIIPPAVAIFSPSKAEIQQKSKATLVCLASGFYPDHLDLVWKVNGATRAEGVGTDEFSTRNGSTYSLTSRLRISAQEWFNPSNSFECVANFFKAGTQQSIHKLIYGDAGCALTEGMCVFSQASICIYFNLSFADVKYKVCETSTRIIAFTSPLE
ncbi:TRBC2 protein, partial [Amazona guildingii]|nr:TRBC2 protein [Amazona guildingii]